MSKQYVVFVMEANRGDPTTFKKYVGAYAYRAYENSEPYRALSLHLCEAFVFKNEVSAEIAAFMVGGKVEEVDEQALERDEKALGY